MQAVQLAKLREKIKFTYSDYLIMPNNGKQCQLIEGEFFMSPAPFIFHQKASGNIEDILRAYVKKRNLGEVFYAPTDVVFSKEDVVQPDILFISKDRQHIINKRNIKGAPDLVIEILSKTTKNLDLKIKLKLYARYGVPEYWIVNPDNKTIDLLYLTEDGYKTKARYSGDDVLVSEVVPGFKMKLKEVF